MTEPDDVHEFDPLLRYFRDIREAIAPKLSPPRAGAMAAFLAVMTQRGHVMTTTVLGRPHAFLRFEYGTGEWVDVDAAGDDVGAEEVRVEKAGELFPEALPVPLETIDPRILLTAAEAARVSDYPKSARALRKAAEQRDPRLLS